MHAVEKIGHGRQFENPNDYVEAETGKSDGRAPCETMTEDERFPLAENPVQNPGSPFGIGG